MNDMCRVVLRKPQRLDGFDYSQGYAYFITLCLQDRVEIFGRLNDPGVVELSPVGRMIDQVWRDMPRYNPGLMLDAYVIMPDHFHAILGLIDAKVWRGQCPSATDQDGDHSATDQASLNLPDVVRRFKTLTTKKYGEGVRDDGWTPYDKHFWQRSYWDRILRSEQDLQSHREYIRNNPVAKWLVNHDR